MTDGIHSSLQVGLYFFTFPTVCLATAHILSTKNYYQMLINLSDPSCENPSVHIGKIYTDTKEDHKGNLVHLADKLVAEGELVFFVKSAPNVLSRLERHTQRSPQQTIGTRLNLFIVQLLYMLQQSKQRSESTEPQLTKSEEGLNPWLNMETPLCSTTVVS